MHNTHTRKFRASLLICVTIIMAGIYISLTNGTFDLAVIDIIRTLLRINPQADHDLVVFDFRLPRIVIGALVGFGLGIAGAVIQGVTRNPLADPGILGINAGAGAAVVLYMFLVEGQIKGADWFSVLTMPLFGWIGGLAAVALIYLFAVEKGVLDPQRFILVGIAIASGFGAITLYLSLKMNPRDYEMAVVWLAGSVYHANWNYVITALPWLVILTPLIWRKAKVLDLFQLQEASTKGLGVATDRERHLLLLYSVGLVSACISVSGSIGFVGLIAPHMAKRLVGYHHKYIIPLCGAIGMAMVVIADLIGKTVFAPAQLPVGIVISIIGVPYFVYLLFKARK